MKHYKNTIILGIIVLLLAAAYFSYDKKSSSQISATGNVNSFKIFDLDLKAIKTIFIENKGESFIIAKHSNNWVLEKPSDIRYDQSIIDALPLSLYYLTADKLIAKEAEHPENYGFNNPLRITVRYPYEKAAVLEIGSPTATGEGCYARVSGSNTVYLLNSGKAAPFFITSSSIKDKNVLALHDYKKIYNKIDEINSVTLERKGKKVFSAVRSDESSWQLTYPLKIKIDESVLKPILDSIVRVTAKEFIDENPIKLDQYGLKYPAYSLEFSISGDRKKLLIGNEKVSGSEFYAKVDSSTDIFSLDEAGFDYLDKSFKEILSR